ncbi:TetR/AcrR family transcriptional regulator [Rubrivirga sp.]|uniref:TetR/AcrR family transcriptional regulator n=1 Tax=Rubrivirga sp. TaxID=1885344 RepID=UPI003B5276B7
MASAHVLDAAERVFLERGYAGTRLRDIADVLGIRPASLYHHAPGGKRELWDRVVARAFDRHRDGLRTAAEQAGPTLRDELVSMASWLLAQPPVNVAALAASDIGAAPKDEAHETAERMYQSLMVPIADVYRAAQERGEALSVPHPDLFSGVFVAAVNGLAATERAGSLPRAANDLAAEVVSLLLDGVLSQREGN